MSAFELAVAPHLRMLRTVAVGLTHNVPDAEDLVQDTMIKALGAWERFESSGSAHAWLYVILTNLFYQQWRRRCRRSEIMADYTNQVADAIQRADSLGTWLLYRDLQTSLAGLDVRRRRILELSMEGHPYKAIARDLDIPIGTVMSNLHRARQHLAASMGVSC